jgi:DNA-binding beta-propeller fold protein YncE
MLRHLGFVQLPAHTRAGGFDHAAVHGRTGRAYVAHTANDALDVVDLAAGRYLGSIPGLPAVAGALVTERPELVLTSNRGDDTVGVVSLIDESRIDTIHVGVRPNGLAYDPGRGRLLVAHVGDLAIAGSCTITVIDVHHRRRIADLAMPGRTRWAVFDPRADTFHVNVVDPPSIVVVDAGDPVAVRRTVTVPAAGPHGLDIDVVGRRLFCACDAARVVEVDADTGDVCGVDTIAGGPDVVFFNAGLQRLYVAVGIPGVIEVFDTRPWRRHETVPTEPGAHTLAFDPDRNLLGALLPATHRAAVYVDEASPPRS